MPVGDAGSVCRVVAFGVRSPHRVGHRDEAVVLALGPVDELRADGPTHRDQLVPGRTLVGDEEDVDAAQGRDRLLGEVPGEPAPIPMTLTWRGATWELMSHPRREGEQCVEVEVLLHRVGEGRRSWPSAAARIRLPRAVIATASRTGPPRRRGRLVGSRPLQGPVPDRAEDRLAAHAAGEGAVVVDDAVVDLVAPRPGVRARCRSAGPAPSRAQR